MPNYEDTAYWDQRYEKGGVEASFDWLETYENLKDLLEQFMVSKQIRILILGCGNAQFSEDLYDDGYHNVVNVDISSVVIRLMKERNEERRPDMEYIVMDITDMSEFESNSFDLVIDKSTIDCLLCCDESFLKVAMMLKESQRVLKVDGIYFAISYGKPDSRSFHFDQPFLGFENREFVLYDQNVSEEEKEDKTHYIYVSKKLANADSLCEYYYETCLAELKATLEAARENEDQDQEQEVNN